MKEVDILKIKKITKFILAAFTVILLGAGGFLLWYFRPVSAVTGQAPEEAYQNGTPAFYRREQYYPLKRLSLIHI